MADLGTLALGTYTNITTTSKTGADPVLEVIASANDGTYVFDNTNSSHGAFCFMTLGDMPANFKFMETVSIRLRYLAAAAMTNTWDRITARLVKSDGVTALSDLTVVVTGPITTTTGTNSAVVSFLTVDTTATAADWNGALVQLGWTVTRNKGGDSVEKRITAAEVTGTYTIDTSVNISDDVTVAEDVTVVLAQLRIGEVFDTVTVAESVAYNLTQLPLEISTSDLVIVQEGQESIPKMNVFEAVTITEVVTLNLILAPSVFDLILTQDSPAVQPIFFSLAISVFDNVLVQEGQEDLNTVRPSVIDAITVDDNTVSIVFNLLRMNVSDVVTVLDVPGVDAQGPLGIIVFDNVLAQEFIKPLVSVYINAFEDVYVDDGSRLLDEFEEVTVTEDITVKLDRLVIEVFDAVALEESIDADGLQLDILEGTTIEDLIVSEEVTVLLTTLNPETVFDAVTLDESVTVFVSSISLTVDVSDDVTVLDVVETIQLNPLQIDEFTEVSVLESVETFTNLLLIDVADMVTVSEDVTMVLLPILLNVFDEVSVTERVAMRITSAGTTSAQRGELPVLGAGR
jgi:hypothetical protein